MEGQEPPEEQQGIPQPMHWQEPPEVPPQENQGAPIPPPKIAMKAPPPKIATKAPPAVNAKKAPQAPNVAQKGVPAVPWENEGKKAQVPAPKNAPKVPPKAAPKAAPKGALADHHSSDSDSSDEEGDYAPPQQGIGNPPPQQGLGGQLPPWIVNPQEPQGPHGNPPPGYEVAPQGGMQPIHGGPPQAEQGNPLPPPPQVGKKNPPPPPQGGQGKQPQQQQGWGQQQWGQIPYAPHQAPGHPQGYNYPIQPQVGAGPQQGWQGQQQGHPQMYFYPPQPQQGWQGQQAGQQQWGQNPNAQQHGYFYPPPQGWGGFPPQQQGAPHFLPPQGQGAPPQNVQDGHPPLLGQAPAPPQQAGNPPPQGQAPAAPQQGANPLQGGGAEGDSSDDEAQRKNELSSNVGDNKWKGDKKIRALFVGPRTFGHNMKGKPTFGHDTVVTFIAGGAIVIGTEAFWLNERLMVLKTHIHLRAAFEWSVNYAKSVPPPVPGKKINFNNDRVKEIVFYELVCAHNETFRGLHNLAADPQPFNAKVAQMCIKKSALLGVASIKDIPDETLVYCLMKPAQIKDMEKAEEEIRKTAKLGRARVHTDSSSSDSDGITKKRVKRDTHLEKGRARSRDRERNRGNSQERDRGRARDERDRGRRNEPRRVDEDARRAAKDKAKARDKAPFKLLVKYRDDACDKCHGVGHSTRKCLKELREHFDKCNLCGGWGHTQRVCTSEKKE